MSDVVKNAATGTIGLAKGASAAAVDVVEAAAGLAGAGLKAPVTVGEKTAAAVIEEVRGLLAKAFDALQKISDDITTPLP